MSKRFLFYSLDCPSLVFLMLSKLHLYTYTNGYLDLLKVSEKKKKRRHTQQSRKCTSRKLNSIALTLMDRSMKGELWAVCRYKGRPVKPDKTHLANPASLLFTNFPLFKTCSPSAMERIV